MRHVSMISIAAGQLHAHDYTKAEGEELRRLVGRVNDIIHAAKLEACPFPLECDQARTDVPSRTAIYAGYIELLHHRIARNDGSHDIGGVSVDYRVAHTELQEYIDIPRLLGGGRKSHRGIDIEQHCGAFGEPAGAGELPVAGSPAVIREMAP